MYSGLSEMLSINTSQLVLIWDQFALEKGMTNIKSTETLCVLLTAQFIQFSKVASTFSHN